jgi:uncharacterized protein
MTDRTTSSDNRVSTRRPGWPELIAAAIGYVAGYLATPFVVDAIGVDDGVVRGLVAAAMSGIVGLVAFFAAYLIRLRDWSAFGVRRVKVRWILIGAGLGILVFVLGRGAFAIFVLTGTLPPGDPQEDYQAAAAGGPLMLTLQLLLIAVLTPIGEEFAFRGVLVSALRRYGAVLSVVVSTLVFLLAHGLNLTLIPAALVGIASAILLLRTGSIWPGVVIHAVNNGVGTVLEVVLPGLG